MPSSTSASSSLDNDSAVSSPRPSQSIPVLQSSSCTGEIPFSCLKEFHPRHLPRTGESSQKSHLTSPVQRLAHSPVQQLSNPFPLNHVAVDKTVSPKLPYRDITLGTPVQAAQGVFNTPSSDNSARLRSVSSTPGSKSPPKRKPKQEQKDDAYESDGFRVQKRKVAEAGESASKREKRATAVKRVYAENEDTDAGFTESSSENEFDNDSADSMNDSSSVAIAAEAVPLETFLNNLNPGLGTEAAPFLAKFGITAQAQFSRFRRIDWWLEFFDTRLAGKGLQPMDECVFYSFNK